MKKQINIKKKNKGFKTYIVAAKFAILLVTLVVLEQINFFKV